MKLYSKDENDNFVELAETTNIENGDLIILTKNLDAAGRTKVAEVVYTILNRKVVTLPSEIVDKIYVL